MRWFGLSFEASGHGGVFPVVKGGFFSCFQVKRRVQCSVLGSVRSTSLRRRSSYCC